MENKNVRARIKDNILRFKEGIDFIDIKGAYDTSTLESFAPKEINGIGLYNKIKRNRLKVNIDFMDIKSQVNTLPI